MPHSAPAAGSVDARRIDAIRTESRTLVRELGFMNRTLADTALPASGVHALIEVGLDQGITARDLGKRLLLEKSTISRLLTSLIGKDLLRTGRSRDSRKKPLSLTRSGYEVLGTIIGHAEKRVGEALALLPDSRQGVIVEGIALYADALRAARMGAAVAMPDYRVQTGGHPGAIGRIAQMHGHYYATRHGSPVQFEAIVASGLSDFACRLDHPKNELWLALSGERILASLAIDGEDLGPGQAHLRWFFVDDALRGTGLGRHLLQSAIGFCEDQGFEEIILWTFRGLDAARHLYESEGFTLIEEKPGTQWALEVQEQCFRRSCR